MTDLEKIKKDPFYIQHIENQTVDICIEAVKQKGNTLQYVKHQTLEICL